MSAIDNFRQAMRELFGLNRDGKRSGERVRIPAETDSEDGGPAPSEMPNPEAFASARKPVFEDPTDGGGIRGETEFPGAPDGSFAGGAYDRQEVTVMGPQKDTSIIAGGTVVTGSIKTDGHIEVYGRIDGNVDAEGDVAIQGRVMGNVRGNYLGLYSSRVRGNLKAASGVVIDNDSVVIGDVSTESILIVDGKLKGDISAGQTAVFKSKAHLLGNLTARVFSVEAGAVMNGMIKTTHDLSEDNPFDFM